MEKAKLSKSEKASTLVKNALANTTEMMEHRKSKVLKRNKKAEESTRIEEKTIDSTFPGTNREMDSIAKEKVI